MEQSAAQKLDEKTNIYSWIGVILLAAGLGADFFWLSFTISGDGIDRFDFMNTLVHQAKITSMTFSMVGPLFSLPLWWISGLFKDSTAVIERYNLLIFIIFLIGWVVWLRNKFNRKFLLTVILLLTFGSMFPGHLLKYYGEVFSAICLTLGTTGLAFNRSKTGAIMAWSFLFLAVLNTPALLVAFSLIVLYKIWETKKIRYLALIPACLVLMLLEAALRTGGLLAGFHFYLSENHGFQTVLPFSGKIGYSYPFYYGLLSVLFSFGKGLVFYCPGFFLIGMAWRSISDPGERKMMIQWILIGIGLVLAYSSWWSWYGGYYWGPRFFLFASVPASWILARLIHSQPGSLLRSIFITLVVIWSLWVGVNGAVFQQKTLDVCYQHNYSMEFLCWYVPEFSPLLHPFITHATFRLNDRLLLIVNAVAWIYMVLPLGLDLIRPVRRVLEQAFGYLRFSNWKL